ncbi:hypothetical protein F5Y14DRAFT_96916 [Nemania sp. NC0429]|nr:hypothetical protein F5Y14DRAFT_96916 [Nemania sp. NC0429]
MTTTSPLPSQSGLLFDRILPRNMILDPQPTHIDWSPTSLPLPTMEEKTTSSPLPAEVRPQNPLEDPNTLSRPIGTLEMFFKRLGEFAVPANREHAAFFTVVQLRFPSEVTNPEKYIARAWEVVGRRYPALRAEVSPPDAADPKGRYGFTVRPFDKESFQSSFSIHPGCTNVDELFTPPSPMRSTATCYWLPSPGQIILRTSHWRADGFGQILLTDVFMTTLANILERGLDGVLDESLTELPLDGAITPGLEDLIEKYSPAEAEVDPADADILMDALINGGKSIALPTIPGSEGAAATTCSRAGIRMSAESSAELARACKAQGVSVTSALNAAIIRATARYPQEPDTDAYVIFAPVDLRGPLIAAGAHVECAQPTGTYVSGLPLRIEGVVSRREETGESVPGKTFTQLAGELSAFYSQDLLRYRRPGAGDDEKAVNLLQLADPYFERMTEFFATFPAPGCPYPKTPVISSLGKMDSLVRRGYEYKYDGDAAAERRVDVTDFWVGIENATPMVTFHPWSWADELTLSAAWNDSFYSDEIVIGALEKIMEELGEGLKMEHVSYRIVHACCEL